MDTRELDILLQRCALQEPTIARYLGVLPFDWFPSAALASARSSCYFIINTDTSNEPGTHWLAIYFDTRLGQTEFFDSYGNSPTYYNLNSTHFTSARTLAYNRHQLQSDTSFVCGQYCVYFLYSRIFAHTSHSIADFSNNLLLRFGSQQNTRDRFVSNYINQLKCQLKQVPSFKYRPSAFQSITPCSNQTTQSFGSFQFQNSYSVNSSNNTTFFQQSFNNRTDDSDELNSCFSLLQNSRSRM